MMRFKDEVKMQMELIGTQNKYVNKKLESLDKQMETFEGAIEAISSDFLTLENRFSELEAQVLNLEARFNDDLKLDEKKAEHDAERKEVINLVIAKYKKYPGELTGYEGEILKNWMIWD
jgi:DNA replication protein DnaD